MGGAGGAVGFWQWIPFSQLLDVGRGGVREGSGVCLALRGDYVVQQPVSVRLLDQEVGRRFGTGLVRISEAGLGFGPFREVLHQFAGAPHAVFEGFPHEFAEDVIDLSCGLEPGFIVGREYVERGRSGDDRREWWREG